MYKAFSARAIGFDVEAARAVPIAANNGFEGYWFDIVRDVGRDAAAIRELLESRGMRAAGFNLPVDIRGEEMKFRDDIGKLASRAAVAQQLGLDRCITWILPASDEFNYKDNLARHVSRLGEAAKILGDCGMRLGLEFLGPPKLRRGMKHEFIHDLDGAIELCTAIREPNVGVLLDVWHWDLAGNTAEDFRKIPDEAFVVLVHLNDAPAGIPPEEQEDLSRELPGATGVLQVGAFMEGLRELGYTGPAVVEPFSATLKTMSFEDAVAATKSAVDRVWLS